ncbi:MAG TPA: creatininase family protein [Trueperaceae bacterium]
MPTTFDLAFLTSSELAQRQDARIALQPIGATEQHGANLALGTDSLAAEAIARRLAERLAPRAVVLPTLPYGISEHHMGFPGTLTLGPETVLALLRDVARSLHRQGFRMLMFINGHNGNTSILNVASAAIRYELDLPTAAMFYFKQAADVVKECGKTDRYGHACEIETSVMLYLDERCVRKAELEPGDMIPSERAFADNSNPYALYAPIPFADQTRNGVFGDARFANREVGERIIETALDRTVAFVNGFLANAS